MAPRPQNQNAEQSLTASVIAAIKRQAGHFRAKDPTPYIAAAANAAAEGVCARCLLRFAGHTTFEDYALQSPPGPALLEALHAASRQQGQQPPAPAAPAAASACGASTCPLCMGLLGALLDEHPAATPPAPTPSEPMPQAAAAAAPAGGAAAAAAAADGTATAEAVTAAAPAAAGAGAVDAVWLRIQARAVPGAGGGRAGGGGGGGGKPGPAADHEPLAEAALAAVVAAVRRQAVEGPPDDIRDRLAAVAATGAAAVAAQGGDGDGDVAMGEGAPAPAAAVVAEQEAAQQQGQEAAAPQSVDLAGLPLGPQLPFDSFVVEVPAVPASNAVRDHALHARLMSLYGKQGMYGGWRFEDVTPLATVLRRALPLVLSRQLGKPCVGPQVADVVVSVCCLDGPDGLAHVRALAEDQAAHRAARQQQFGGHGGRGANKRQRRGGGGGGGRGGGGGGPPAVSESAVQSMSWEAVSGALSSMPYGAFNRLFPWPLPKRAPAEGGAAASAPTAGPAQAAAAAATGPRLYVRAAHAPILLAGRYCKLRRHMPQCPWFELASGKRIGGTSVQEAIEAVVLPAYGSCTAKMITGGREDADVRMLGAGRPFVLEIQAPLRSHPPAATLRELEQRMVASKCGVSLQGLTPCGKAALESIKAAEESKEKTYRALCWSEAPLQQERELAGLVALGRVTCQQDTPVRVLHRRAPKLRPKWVEIESAKLVPGRPHYFVLEMRTQAGTYVKEFCHGDFGRCRPSVGDLLARIRAEAGPAAGTGTNASAERAEAVEAGAAATATGSNAEAGVAGGKGGAVPTAADAEHKVAEAAGGAGTGATAGAAGGTGAGSGSGACGGPSAIHVEILQLDVLDVHLENWP